MPNGVSCAYFAARNHIYGHNENNVFKEGIAGCQTVRTIDSLASTRTIQNAVPMAKSTAGFWGKAAKFARKIVYPLIIASGIYNTARAKDKVKTGAMQAGGIGTMFAFETVAEKALKNIAKKLLDKPVCQQHKAARIGVYVAKGLAFVGASLLGYTVGSNGAENIVNKIRAKKALKAEKNNTEQATEKKEFPVENDLKKSDIQETLFEDMKLQ